MATGMAIMGFGGGAMIGSPLADTLMKHFATPTAVGVEQTFLVMGSLYFVAMMAGAFGYRLPAPGWSPAGWTPPARQQAATDAGSVPVSTAWRTKQFWLLWGVLCLNVSAGIGVLGIASPMIQEIFRGRVTASDAGFTGPLSCSHRRRIFWASLSDRIGRKVTYTVFFTLGMALYALAPTAGATHSLALFVLIFGVILTMYGGGFATNPAYLADRFGVANVGAIHGRLLTAWSTAGILGPFLVNGMREAHIPYAVTLYILVGFLAVGLICNLLVHPVPASLFTLKGDLASGAAPAAVSASAVDVPVGHWGLVVIAWVLVGLPLGWGLFKTVTLAPGCSIEALVRSSVAHDMDPTSKAVVSEIVGRLKDMPGALQPILHGVQDALGYVPESAVPVIAEGLNLSRAEVHVTISFYHYFRETPPGRRTIHLCRAEACQSMHQQGLEAHAKQRFWH
jgi:hypothetical protein